MSLFRAVVWTDHQSAQVLQFDPEHVTVHKVKAHAHPTAQHGSGVRTEHEFFGALCDSLEGIAEVLVTGSHTAIADLRHYIDKHRPRTASHVIGYEVVDHPTEKQLVALARKFFLESDRMSGVPTPT